MATDYTSMAALAKRCGVTHRTVSQWLKHPKFPLQREGPWSEDDAVEIMAWRGMALQPNRASPEYQGKTGIEPVAEEQTKDYWLMRRYRAMALEQEGRVIDTGIVMRAWFETVADIRDQMLSVAASVQGLLSLSNESTRQLDEYIRRTLDGVADRMVNAANAAKSVRGDGESDPSAEGDEAERVGGSSSLHAEEHDGESRPVAE